MLKSQQELNFSQYTDLYDKLIPQNHLFRKINELIDFSFIREELKYKYCPDNGRTAEDPEYLFKFLFLKCLHPMSDVDLVERALYDLSYKSADTSFFGYKTHIAMTPERIITAATITSGEKPDGKELPELVEKSRKAGMTVENVIADRAYSGKDKLTLAIQKDENDKKNFMLISRPNPSITEGFKQLSKEHYKIEAKNSELKNVLGYDVSMGNCLYATKIQGACTIFAANIKRIITILDEK